MHKIHDLICWSYRVTGVDNYPIQRTRLSTVIEVSDDHGDCRILHQGMKLWVREYKIVYNMRLRIDELHDL